MKDRLEQIKKDALAQIEAADALEKLNDVKVKYLGKKGELTAVLKSMKDVAPEDRPKVGQMVNETRAVIEEMLEATKTKMEKAIREEKLKQEVIDVTLPSKKSSVGHRHPNNIALEEVERIFVGMGYEVVEGPEVEYDLYNFEKLNIPADHPAKDEQDTFYINKDIVLRTGACDGAGKTSDPYDRAGKSVPFRRSRCDPLSVIPSDRGTCDRQKCIVFGSERNIGGICKRIVRT